MRTIDKINLLLKARPLAAQSFRAISIQQRIASKLTLYNLDRVWFDTPPGFSRGECQIM